MRIYFITCIASIHWQDNCPCFDRPTCTRIVSLHDFARPRSMDHTNLSINKLDMTVSLQWHGPCRCLFLELFTQVTSRNHWLTLWIYYWWTEDIKNLALVQDLEFGTLTVKIQQSWKFDLSVDLWPWRKGQMKRSQWTLLIVSPRPTIWHVNCSDTTKLKILPLCWPLTPKKGSDIGVPWQLSIVWSRPTIWHLNSQNQTKFKIWPFCWPLTPREGSDIGVTMTTFDR